jgi:hypothetical protein
MLISGVLLRNKRRFKASFLAISAGFHRRMGEIFPWEIQHQNSEGKGSLREWYGEGFGWFLMSHACCI